MKSNLISLRTLQIFSNINFVCLFHIVTRVAAPDVFKNLASGWRLCYDWLSAVAWKDTDVCVTRWKFHSTIFSRSNVSIRIRTLYLIWGHFSMAFIFLHPTLENRLPVRGVTIQKKLTYCDILRYFFTVLRYIAIYWYPYIVSKIQPIRLNFESYVIESE